MIVIYDVLSKKRYILKFSLNGVCGVSSHCLLHNTILNKHEYCFI